MPIIQQIPVSTPAPPCPCGEVDKFWFCFIDPAFAGFGDMTNWSIDGVDFIIGVNGVMSGTYGGSGTAYYNLTPFLGSLQFGWIAYYGKFSSLPQPDIKDPLGNSYALSWSYYSGGICGDANPGDYQTCVTFELPKVDPNIYYLDLYWFDPYIWNTQTGYPTNDGYTNAIDILTMNGGPLSMTGPGADIILKNYLDPFFLNGVNVTLTPTPTHIQIKISFIYAMRCGYYENATGKWKEMMRTSTC